MQLHSFTFSRDSSRESFRFPSCVLCPQPTFLPCPEVLRSLWSTPRQHCGCVRFLSAHSQESGWFRYQEAILNLQLAYKCRLGNPNRCRFLLALLQGIQTLGTMQAKTLGEAKGYLDLEGLGELVV